MEIKEHKFIILGSYSANVLGQIRGLGEKGIRPIGVFVHKETYRVDKSKYLSKVYPVNTIEEGLDLVIRIYGQESKKPFLYTDRDNVMALIDKRYNELKDKFFVWNAGEQGRLSVLLNKYEQFKLAEECGIRIPKTEYVKVGELPKTLNYPIFTKATDSLNPYWKGNAYICNNDEELRQAYDRMDVKYILLQEYIVKRDELPIEGISLREGEEIRLLGRTVSYRFQKDSFGTYRYVEPYSNPELEVKINNLIQKFHYTGAFEIEFIIDQNGIEYYLETNFRIAQLPKKKVNIMHEFEDFKICVLNKESSLMEWIKDVRNTNCFSFYDKNDKAPFFYTILEKTKLYLRKVPFVKALYQFL